MPVTSIFWPTGAGQDFHLIPGLTSPRLDHLLWIAHTAGNVRADNPPAGVTVTWASNYAAVTPAAAATGVTVDLTTTVAPGAVTVAAPLAGPARLLDFLVVATVTEGTNKFEAYIRFHVHAGITGMWLTPAELTVPEGAHNIRFSMLAEFTDGTYGDVTNWSPFETPAAGDRTFVHATASPTPDPIVSWSSGAVGAMDVDPKTGVLTCRSAATSAQIDAIAALPPPNNAASGGAVGERPWSTKVTLEHLAGPGVAQIADVPNVLILGDGFQFGERQKFIDLAKHMVAKLHSAPRTRPFDLVKNRMNYFAAFRESREAGIATLSPVNRVPAGVATEIDVAVKPDVAAALGAHVGAPPTPAANTAFLLNERDTAFGAVLGERHRAQRRHELRSAYLSHHRFSEDDFDAFLGALEYPAGNPVGQRWTRRAPDEGSILVLCRTDCIGGTNSTRTDSGPARTGPKANDRGHIICLTLGIADRVGINRAAPGHDIVPDRIPATANVDMRTTAAHELAHSYTLGDEYGDGGGGTATVADELEANRYANLQSRDELLNAPTFTEKIKWRWPRLVHAAALNGPPLIDGAGHHLFFTPGEPTNFPDDKRTDEFPRTTILRLRTRPLPGSVASYRLRVEDVLGDGEIYVEAAEPIPPLTPPLDMAFPAGSIVMEPKRAPDPAGGLGDDLELMHAGVRQWIEVHQNPLNASPNIPPAGLHRPCPGPEPTTDPLTGLPLTSIPARNYGPGNAPKKPTESAWITGLFEGGDRFDCNVYHPTGACIMNVIEVVPGSSYQFCWVCRYAIVDFIDPAMHGAIDRDYDYRYPP